ncbi:MAG: hypothetical protein QM679_02840 [Patulibacter sp.]
MPARRAVLLSSLMAASALWLIFGAVVVVNYDTQYAILWGDQLLRGQSPELTVAGAPTPHPLLTLLGVLAAPIAGGGSPAGLALVAFLGYLATVSCAVLLLTVGRRAIGTAAGAIAATLLITREPVLSYGLRAYVDLPYLALLLAAIGLELARPKRGTIVLALLAVAGLLRPEAWLLSLAYLLWLARRPDGGWGSPGWRTAALALAGPALWATTDLLLTGDPFFSFSGTRAGAERLDRPTGLSGLLTIAPRRIGEILRVDGLAGALLGTALLLRRRPAHSRVVIAATLVAGAAFALVALGGLPVIVRYLLPFGAAGCLAYGYALTGWRAEPSIPAGRAWAGLATLVLALTVMLAPAQAHRLSRLHASLADQQAAIDEARLLVSQAPCGPIAVPNRRAVPLVAMWTGSRAAAVVTTQDRGVPATGTYLLPSSSDAANAFILDARDRDRTIPGAPRGWTLAGRTAHWHMYAHC